jgi:hypothetical protein
MRRKVVQIPILIFLVCFAVWIFVTPSGAAFARRFSKKQRENGTIVILKNK